MEPSDRPKMCPKCTSGNISMIDTNEFYCLKCAHQWVIGPDGKSQEVQPPQIETQEPVTPVPVPIEGKKKREGEVVEPKKYTEDEIKDRLSEDKWSDPNPDPVGDIIKAKEMIEKQADEENWERDVWVPKKMKDWVNNTPEGQEVLRKCEMATGYKLTLRSPDEVFGSD